MITDLKDLLNTIGYDQLRDDGSYWRTSAVYRAGDNKTALRINKRTGAFQDFVEKKSGSIEDLIKLTLGIDDVKLKEFYQTNIVDLNNIVEKQDKPKIFMEKTWNENELLNLLPHYKFYEDKGISKDTLKFFKAGLAHSGSMNQRFVFPIYNNDGKIHGWSGRDMTGKKEAKWKHIGRKAYWIFPAYVPLYVKDASGNMSVTYPVLEEIIRKREVILVESIGDMLALFERGIKNVLCTFGLVVSPRLASFLMALEIDHVIIALNNDFESDINRGKKAAVDMFIDLCHYFDVPKLVIALPECNDFGVINDEQFNKWAAHKQVRETWMYNDVLGELTRRYRGKLITPAEIKIGKAVRSHYDQI
jgi:hypothetical protein